MKKKLYAGTTSHIERVFLQDTSQTDGRGLTGLAYNSSGLTVYYIRQGDASPTQITLVTATVGTWVSGGFAQIDATNMPGWYELHLPNAVIAGGAKSVGIHLRGATNMAPYPIELELDALNYQDAVRAGLSALPNANAGANGGLPLGDASGRVDVGRWLGAVPAALSATGGYIRAMVLRWLTDDAGGTPNALQSGRADSYVGAYASGKAPLTEAETESAAALGAAAALAAYEVTTQDDLDAAETAITTAVGTPLQADDYTPPPTASDIADAVQDEQLSGHQTAGSAGKALSDAGAAGDPWTIPLPGAYANGTAGKILGSLAALITAIPAGVWAWANRRLTATAAETTATMTGSALVITSYCDWRHTLEGLGDLSARTQLYVTVKAAKGDPDSKALVQLALSGGLLYLNRAGLVSPITSAAGSITVDDEGEGNITLSLSAAATALLPASDRTLYYDVKMITAAGVLPPLTEGTATIGAAVTQAVE